MRHRVAALALATVATVAVVTAPPSSASAQQVYVAPPPPPPPPQIGEAPSTGIGLLVTGASLTGIGAINLLTAPLCTTSVFTPSTQSLCLDTSLVLAGITLAIGVPVLVVGVVRHNRYVEWKKSNSLAAKLTDLGIAPILPQGLGTGAPVVSGGSRVGAPNGATLTWQTTF